MVQRLLTASRAELSTRAAFGLPAQAGKAVTREEKVFVIVGFLAMLELVRQGIINAIQERHGEDIIMEQTENNGQ